MRRTFLVHSLRSWPRSIAWAIVVSLVMMTGVQHPAAQTRLASGRSEIVSAFPAGNPEGIALTKSGQLFVGNRLLGPTTMANQILKVERDGTFTVFATLPSSGAAAEGLLGLAADPSGTLYAAFASFDQNHGVYRIDRRGAAIERVAGSEQIGFPNALTFDPRGNLYVTDSFNGAIWRSQQGGPFTLWAQDELLRPLPTDPFGIPLPGANGIAFYPPNLLYVANTERGMILRVQIRQGEGIPIVTAVTAPFAVPTVDGIAMDIDGNIHAAIPAFALVGMSPLVRIEPGNGTVTPTVTDPTDIARFDTPLSVIFGGGRWDAKTLLVTNGDLPILPGGAGPGVVQVGVGVPGFPIP